MSLQEVCVYGVKTIWKVELIYESVAVESTCLLMVPVLSENKLGGGVIIHWTRINGPSHHSNASHGANCNVMIELLFSIFSQTIQHEKTTGRGLTSS